jgi:hypothetical protein
MNLHNQLPSNIYVIDANATDVQAPPRSGKFFAISCSVAGDIIVTGGGIFIYADTTELSDTAAAKLIDPQTSQPFVSDEIAEARGDGYYESIPTEARTIPMIVGQTIYGRFDSVKASNSFVGFAYAG